MAQIIVVTHEYDRFLHPWRPWRRRKADYLLFSVLRAMQRRGHRWRIVSGLRPTPGDIGILHVDRTCVERAYLDLASNYQATVNFRVGDISKRRVSGARLLKGDPWSGPVIVKTDLNYAGRPEAAHNALALRQGLALPFPHLAPVEDYPVISSLSQVPDAVWSDPARVVDRFIPEPDPQGFALRTWVFLGSGERCSRHVASDPMVKAANSISRTPVAVPAALRAERERLGFDYGKFDFVVHEGVPTLLDANKTPGAPPATEAVRRRRAEVLADGLETIANDRRPGATI